MSVLPDVPSLSLLLLQEEKKAKTPPPPPKSENPNKPDKKPAQGENPNKADKKRKQGEGVNPNKAGVGNQGNVARGSSVPTALIIALIGVVGAAGLWFVLRRRSA